MLGMNRRGFLVGLSAFGSASALVHTSPVLKTAGV